MQYQVTHDNFQACLDTVAKGIGMLWIRTYLRHTYINAKALKAWSKVQVSHCFMSTVMASVCGRGGKRLPLPWPIDFRS